MTQGVSELRDASAPGEVRSTLTLSVLLSGLLHQRGQFDASWPWGSLLAAAPGASAGANDARHVADGRTALSA